MSGTPAICKSKNLSETHGLNFHWMNPAFDTKKDVTFEQGMCIGGSNVFPDFFFQITIQNNNLSPEFGFFITIQIIIAKNDVYVIIHLLFITIQWNVMKTISNEIWWVLWIVLSHAQSHQPLWMWLKKKRWWVGEIFHKDSYQKKPQSESPPVVVPGCFCIVSWRFPHSLWSTLTVCELENCPVEIVDLTINSMVIFHSYVTVYQRVNWFIQDDGNPW